MLVPAMLSSVSTRISWFNFLIPVLFNSFPNEFFIEFKNYIISLIGIVEPNMLDGPNRNPF